MIELLLMITLEKKYGKRLVEMEAGEGGVLVTYLTRGGNTKTKLYLVGGEL